MRQFTLSVAALAAVSNVASASVSIDVAHAASIKQAASAAASNLMSYYQTTGGGFPVAGQDWLWYLSGGAWGAFIDHYAYFGDDTYLNKTLDALGQSANLGANFDYNKNVPSEANDDQAFWIFAALAALEQDFPQIPGSPKGKNSWLTIADNAFNDFTQRWAANSNTCNGGLTWSYSPHPDMATQALYKNSVSNGGFFQIAARLARYTGEAKYAQWAEKVWNWSRQVGLISQNYHVLDGVTISDACATPTETEWSYNSGIYMYGAAAMADYYKYKNAQWNKHVEGLVDTSIKQFTTPTKFGKVLLETARECPYGQPHPTFAKCTQGLSADQSAFKGYLARFMGKTATIYPAVMSKVLPVLQASAKGAANTGTGAANGKQFSRWWFTTHLDDMADMQDQLTAFEVFNSLLSMFFSPGKA